MLRIHASSLHLVSPELCCYRQIFAPSCSQSWCSTGQHPQLSYTGKLPRSLCGNTVPSEKGDTVARVDISLTSLVVLFVQPHFCVSFSSTTSTYSLALGTLPTIPGLHTMLPGSHVRRSTAGSIGSARCGFSGLAFAACWVCRNERTPAAVLLGLRWPVPWPAIFPSRHRRLQQVTDFLFLWTCLTGGKSCRSDRLPPVSTTSQLASCVDVYGHLRKSF